MGEAKAGLEVELIEREHPHVDMLDEHSVNEHSFYATVLGYESRAYGSSILKIFYEHGGFVMRDINVDQFWIVSATYTPGDNLPGSFTDIYGLTFDEQESAYEMIQGVIMEEDLQGPLFTIPEEGEKQVTARSTGPRRLEITVKNPLGIEKKLVVTDILGPAGQWNNYNLSGRELKDKKLSIGVEPFHAPAWRVLRVDTILGQGQGSAIEHYGPDQASQKRAWQVLEKIWCKFSDSEKRICRAWTPAEETARAQTEEEWADGWGNYGYGGNQHWTNRTPSRYQPEVIEPAHYRVKGDVVGAELFRKQEEEQGEALSLEAALEFMEKKDEAGDDDSSADAADSSSDTSSGDSSSTAGSEGEGSSAGGDDGSALCSCTAGQYCSECLDESFDVYGFGSGVMVH